MLMKPSSSSNGFRWAVASLPVTHSMNNLDRFFLEWVRKGFAESVSLRVGVPSKAVRMLNEAIERIKQFKMMKWRWYYFEEPHRTREW